MSAVKQRKIKKQKEARGHKMGVERKWVKNIDVANNKTKRFSRFSKSKRKKSEQHFRKHSSSAGKEPVGGFRSNQNEIEVLHESPSYGESQSKSRKKKRKPGRSEEENKGCTSQSQEKCLNFRAGFVWNATIDQLPALLKHKKEESSSEEELPEEHNKKKKKRLTKAEQRGLIRQEEEQIRKTEQRLLNAEINPQSADDFDRLVMSAPNNSKNWIRYVAFHIEATEIAKARAVAQRALKTISFREEQEKLNVWLALLNLENLFGTRETLEQTLQEAVNLNDPYKVHMQVITMFSTTKKIEELDKLVQYIIKKYKQEKDTWIQVGTAYIKCGEAEKSRQIMRKALAILEKKHHVEVLSRFAILESEYGETVRAETIMENILTSYPKRIDVWMVYIDMLVKLKKFDLAKRVLDRAIIQKLAPSKMKSLFKKYLKFENDHGTPQGVEQVKEMAKKYVESGS